MKWLVTFLVLVAFSALGATNAPFYINNITRLDANGNVISSVNFPPPPMPPDMTNATATSTVLHSPKHKAYLQSLGTPMKRAAVAAAPKLGWLIWNYPSDQLTNVFFDVYHTTALTNTPPLSRWDQVPNNFSLMSTVDSATQLSITFSQMQEFFIVRARDKISGVVSNWNVP